MKTIRRWGSGLAALILVACGGGQPLEHGVAGGDEAPRPPAIDTLGPLPRTLPNPFCLPDYLGTTGLLVAIPDLGRPDALHGGERVSDELNERLPRQIWAREAHQSFGDDYAFVIHEGSILARPLRPETAEADHWRQVVMPWCLSGQVREISADGSVLLALGRDGWIYTLDYANYGPGAAGWTRRWGPFFWIDLGERMPEDVLAWATSHFRGGEIYLDSAGREQAPAGILTVYTLRGNGWQLTYMDPWLPSDESREVCGPERGQLALAGLSGSGSNVMVISREGRVFTRLYEFDIAGGNTMFLDYSWQDQDGVGAPLIQLPGPGWVDHGLPPGRVTTRISLHKSGHYSDQRVLRVEGVDPRGDSGYWEKSLPEPGWRFVVTGEPLQGIELPLPPPYRFVSEDQDFAGEIDGHPVRIEGLNPYCSPARMTVELGGGESLELRLHSADGMRQERRGRGWDHQPHVYQGAVEVPLEQWQGRGQASAAVRRFLDQHFPTQRFLTGPLDVTPQRLVIHRPCWRFDAIESPPLTLDGLLPPRLPDLGILIGELRAAQEQERLPALCLR